VLRVFYRVRDVASKVSLITPAGCSKYPAVTLWELNGEHSALHASCFTSTTSELRSREDPTTGFLFSTKIGFTYNVGSAS
jgi:hypothetical protein